MQTQRHIVYLADKSKMLTAEQEGDIAIAVREYEVDIEGWEVEPGNLTDNHKLNLDRLHNCHDRFYNIDKSTITVDGIGSAFFATGEAAVNEIIQALHLHYADHTPANPSFIEALEQLPKGWRFYHISKVLFHSPAADEPKVYSVEVVPGKTKITERHSYCIHFSLNEREFIADTRSWKERDKKGYIYVLERKIGKR